MQISTEKILRILFLFTLLILSYATWAWLHQASTFPLSTIKIESNYQNIPQQELKKIISNFFPAGFFSLDADNLELSLRNLPWTESVIVTRTWPNTLKIRLIEKKVVARWGSDGLLDSNGKIFFLKTDTIDSNLPILYNERGNVREVLFDYNFVQLLLTKKELGVADLHIDKNNFWRLKLTNGLVLILGKNKPKEKLKRFLLVYDNVFKERHVSSAEQVDLRYSHGLAVKWKNKN